ncbi:MAG TPA: outer membrane beta-barrel protein [Candidatus Binatia bacterium]|nr:outer membrane beta-barrel protein [Candidatus Binatia bacterium]
MSTRVGKIVPTLGGALLALWATAAIAQPLAPTEGESAPYVTQEEEKEPAIKAVPPLQYFDRTADGIKKWFDKRGLTIGSGLSTAFQWDFNDPANFKVPFRSLDNWHSRYFVGLFQLTLGYNPTPEKGQFGWVVKGDAGRIARRIKSDWNGSGFVPDTQWEHHEIELQDAYVMYNVPIGNGLTLKGGKFVTLLGAEVIEPWLNPNWSRSYLFGFAIPFTHVGGLATYPITDMVSITAGGVMGWDDVEDNNNSPSVIGQLAVVPNDRVSVYVNGIYGPEQPCNPEHAVLPGGNGCNRNKRGVVDVVANVKLTDQFSFIFNGDWASEDEASVVNPGRHSTWDGMAGILTFQPINPLMFAVRGEWFEDAQGSRTGVQQQLWEVTFDAKYMLSQYIYTRAEYRHDESNQNVFTANKSFELQGQDTVAIELGYYF